MTRSSDEELLRAVQAGDTDSLGVLVARWEQPLFRFVYRLMPRQEDARDVCQETFLRILKKANRFRLLAGHDHPAIGVALNVSIQDASADVLPRQPVNEVHFLERH